MSKYGYWEAMAQTRLDYAKIPTGPRKGNGPPPPWRTRGTGGNGSGQGNSNGRGVGTVHGGYGSSAKPPGPPRRTHSVHRPWLLWRLGLPPLYALSQMRPSLGSVAQGWRRPCSAQAAAQRNLLAKVFAVRRLGIPRLPFKPRQ